MTAEKKLWLIEGIPGSGKSTAARKLGQNLHAQVYNEAELHPCDLAWHAVLSRAELDAFIARHPDKERAICETARSAASRCSSPTRSWGWTARSLRAWRHARPLTGGMRRKS